MTVTATAGTSEPNGSPIRCATVSAWCTAASTAAASAMPTKIWMTTPGLRSQVRARRTAARIGTNTVHDRNFGRRAVVVG